MLLAEEANLEAILIETTVATPELINALSTLAYHQAATRLRTDVIKHALHLAYTMADNATLLGPLLYCYADILFGLGHYNAATEQFTLAHKSFLSVNEKAQAAKSLLEIADIYAFTIKPFEATKAVIEEAKSDVESINDIHGIAVCLYRLGVLSWQFGHYPAAEDYLNRAKVIFTDLQDSLYLARCSRYLGSVYRGTKRYKDAQTAYSAAIQGFKEIGKYDTGPHRALSRIFVLIGDYNSALQLLMQSLEESKSIGNTYDIAKTLEGMGRCWMKMGNKLDAHQAFEESQKYFSSLHTTGGDKSVLLCKFFIKRLENPLLIPTFEEQQKWKAAYKEDTEEIMDLIKCTSGKQQMLLLTL